MLVVWFLAGMVTGCASAATQWWTARFIQRKSPHPVMVLVLGGSVLRWLVAAVVLVVALRQGVGAGLAALVGMMLPRWGLVALLVRDLAPLQRPPE